MQQGVRPRVADPMLTGVGGVVPDILVPMTEPNARALFVDEIDLDRESS